MAKHSLSSHVRAFIPTAASLRTSSVCKVMFPDPRTWVDQDSMSNIGNAIGTWKTCAPLRLCAGAFTSTASGSCDGHTDRINTALSKLRELHGGDWKPCEFIRLQEELGSLDFIGIHGYIIIKLCNAERTSLSPQFMRLDWGHDGFAVQVAASDNDFRSYFRDTDSRVLRAGKKMMRTSAVVGGLVLGGSAVLAAAAPATATTAAGTAIGVAGGAATGYAGASSVVADLYVPDSPYEIVGQSASLRSIIRAVEEKAETPYDLVSWNCNHFANYLVDVLRKQG